MAYGPYKDLIIAAAQRHGINPVILAGLINQESNFDPIAVGDKGRSFGLGQFNVNGALKTYGLTSEQVLSMDPAQQIDLTADYYKKNLIIAKGDDDKALRLYNGGGDPNYVNKVHRRINKAGMGSPITELPPVASRTDITGIAPDFQENFKAFQQAAKAQGFDITPSSGFRNKARQAQLWAQALTKYGTPTKARKWVAPPGSSSHEHGLAMDLKYGSPEARKWAHANAAKFGLNFRMANEPWHIEPIGARERISNPTKQAFGYHTIDITKPAGFNKSIENFPPVSGFSDKMQRLLTGGPMDDEEDQVLDPNTMALGQLLNAQQSVGQQPDNVMSSIMSNPLIHMGLGIMAGEGNFAQQLSGGLMMGMKNYQAYRAAEQEAQLSNARLQIQAQNAQTAALSAQDRMRMTALKRQAIAELPESIQPYAGMDLAGVDPDVAKTYWLTQQGFDPQTAASMAVTGRTPEVGTKVKDVGGAIVQEQRDISGNIVSGPVGSTQPYAQSAGMMALTKQQQKDFGEQSALLYKSLYEGLPKYGYMINRIDDLASKLQASDAPMTGKVVGSLGNLVDEVIIELERFNTDEALDKMVDAKLAPVSNVDLQEIKGIIASKDRTKAQNLRLLEISKQMYQKRDAELRNIGTRLQKGEPLEQIYLSALDMEPPEKATLPGPAASAYGPRGQRWPTVPSWEPKAPAAGTPPAPAAPAPAAPAPAAPAPATPAPAASAAPAAPAPAAPAPAAPAPAAATIVKKVTLPDGSIEVTFSDGRKAVMRKK